MFKFRKSKKQSPRKKFRKALANITKNNIELQRNNQTWSERNQRQLIQEVQALREVVANLKAKSKQEEFRLKEIIENLQIELYDEGRIEREKGHVEGSSTRGYQPQTTGFWSRIANLTLCCLHEPKTHLFSRGGIQEESETPDVKDFNTGYYLQCFPSINRSSTQRKRPCKPILSGPGYPLTVGEPNEMWATRDFSSRSKRPSWSGVNYMKNRKAPHFGRFRRPPPYPYEYCRPVGSGKNDILTHEKVEAIEDAARAFLSVFDSLHIDVKKALWTSCPEMEMRNTEPVLNINYLSSLLLQIVAFVFTVDNPERASHSPIHTKPLVSLLRLCLAPWVQGKDYLGFEDFMSFCLWLQPSESLKIPVPNGSCVPMRRDDVRSSLQIGSSCFIWSEEGKCWITADVVALKLDAEGEWLVARYFVNGFWREKEVSRYSHTLSGILHCKKDLHPQKKQDYLI